MLVYPCIYSICLLFWSNFVLAGVFHLYTHIYILFACFLGLTPFLQVFCASIPTYTFYLLDFLVKLLSCRCFSLVYPRIHSICWLFGSNSLLAGVLCFCTHIYISLLAFWV